MTKKQVDHILAPVMEVGLPKSGICRKISRAVVFAPIKYLGLGIKHPFISQGVKKIEYFFDQSHQFTSKLIQAAWYRTMIESGFGGDFLEFNLNPIKPCLTDGWITSLWDFLTANKITLRRICKQYHRDVQMPLDSYIMQDVGKKMVECRIGTV
jgi:hypothetical protein